MHCFTYDTFLFIDIILGANGGIAEKLVVLKKKKFEDISISILILKK